MPAIKKGKKTAEAAPRAVQPITKREEDVDEESTEEASDAEEEAMEIEEEDGAAYTVDEEGDAPVAAGRIVLLSGEREREKEAHCSV